jgi:tetratricopeptide (TPR) repeat protein
MIYDRDNRPVHNAAVYVNGQYLAASDIQGHFAISGMKPTLTYTIAVRKPGYEAVEMDIAYTESSYVLYVHILSAEQLVTEAELAIRGDDWGAAESYLDRAKQAGGAEVPILYLSAILEFRREQYPEALRMLTALIEKEKGSPYLYLFIADLYQYYADAPEEARFYLNKFLALRYDPEVERRLAELGDV